MNDSQNPPPAPTLFLVDRRPRGEASGGAGLPGKAEAGSEAVRHVP